MELPSHIQAIAQHAKLLKESSDKHRKAGHDFTADEEEARYEGLAKHLQENGLQESETQE